MAKNISLLGANYQNVPAVQLPQTGGGTATFYDIDVIDNLNSTSATDALSANQGKVLNDNYTLLPIKSYQDKQITAGDYTWTQIGTAYRTTLRVSDLFTKTGLKGVQIVSYGGTLLTAIMDSEAYIVLIAFGNPGSVETITIRGYFNS